MEHSVQYNCPHLMKTWISQASARQRSGRYSIYLIFLFLISHLIIILFFRAGRLFPGVVVRLYSKTMLEKHMLKYDVPEMLRVSLASTLLRLKGTYHSKLLGEREREREREREIERERERERVTCILFIFLYYFSDWRRREFSSRVCAGVALASSATAQRYGYHTSLRTPSSFRRFEIP